MYKFLSKIVSSFVCFVLKKTKLIRSFSQEGEDLIIQRILKEKNIKFKNLFYLDIGAGHPIKYSNTFYFSKCSILVTKHGKNLTIVCVIV